MIEFETPEVEAMDRALDERERKRREAERDFFQHKPGCVFLLAEAIGIKDPEISGSLGHRVPIDCVTLPSLWESMEKGWARVKELEATVTDLKEIIEAEFPGFFDGLEAAASILRGED
jgi:hypothetical protein